MKLYDHAILARCMLGPWLITGGKDGGGEGDICGTDCSVRAWRVDGLDSKAVREVGTRVIMVWAVGSLEALGRVILLLMKRGRPMLEIWGSSSMF
jgi:hypothetical protein